MKRSLRRTTHIAFSLGASMLLLEPPLYLAWLAGFYAALGAALPDLDLRKRHRKLLHNVFALTLTTIAVFLASSIFFGAYAAYLAAFYAAGYAFHLFVDLFTRRGVALLWPFSNRMFRVCRFRSESLAANAFFSMLGAIALALWFLLSTRSLALIPAIANAYKAPTTPTINSTLRLRGGSHARTCSWAPRARFWKDHCS